MSMRTAALLFVTMTLAACEPGTVPSSGPVQIVSEPIYLPPNETTGNTQPSIAAQTAGNPNYDENGNYIGAEGVATVVEIPDSVDDLPVLTVPNAHTVPKITEVPEVTLPPVETPDPATMNCTGVTTENAGTLDCTN